MNKKLTIEFIRDEFFKEWYILLTKVYINAHQKLEYTCPRGHKHSISWNKWQGNRRCPYCINVVKLTIEFVREDFKKYGYELLTTKYINAHQKLDYICPKGHKHSMTWNKWQQKRRCPTCDDIKKIGCGNPSWKGGVSKEPYSQDWNNNLKESIKKRDGYKCMNPDCWGKDDVLNIHHINYNKKICKPENLITVCRSCNGRANKDREWHENWYKAILYNRYGYI